MTDGPWYDLRSCWFNSFYTRTLPSHSSEMTAAYSTGAWSIRWLRFTATRGRAFVSLAPTTKAGCRDSPMRTKEGRDFVTQAFAQRRTSVVELTACSAI